MKENMVRDLSVMAVAFAFVFFTLAVHTYAADESSQKARTESQSKSGQMEKNTGGNADRAQLRVAPSAPMKVSELTGDKVKNFKGEDLGVIDDVVVGPDGKVLYLILSHGGWLNIGDRLFAIPWEAAKPTDQPNTFAVDIDKERFARAPNFDRNTWPNFADPNIYNLNYGYYMSRPQEKSDQKEHDRSDMQHQSQKEQKR